QSSGDAGIYGVAASVQHLEGTERGEVVAARRRVPRANDLRAIGLRHARHCHSLFLPANRISGQSMISTRLLEPRTWVHQDGAHRAREPFAHRPPDYLVPER